MKLDAYIAMLQRVKRLFGNLEVVDRYDKPVQKLELMGDRKEVLDSVYPREGVSVSWEATSAAPVAAEVRLTPSRGTTRFGGTHSTYFPGQKE